MAQILGILVLEFYTVWSNQLTFAPAQPRPNTSSEAPKEFLQAAGVGHRGHMQADGTGHTWAGTPSTALAGFSPMNTAYKGSASKTCH